VHQISNEEVIGEEGLPKLFDKKGKDNFWKLIDYVQTCVKDIGGVGK
jgi:hypothetical protein